MMFCSNCGTKLPNEGGFCPNCGTRAELQQPIAPDRSPLPKVPSQTSAASLQAQDPELPVSTQATLADGSVQAPLVDADLPIPPTATPSEINPDMTYDYTAPEMMVAPEHIQKKSKKKIFIIVGAILVVALIAVGIFAGINIYRSNTYKSGIAQLNSGEYQEAFDTFDKLGDYKDAPDLKTLAQQWIDYRAAQALLDAEDFAAAKQAFDALGNFEDAKEKSMFCQDNIDYIQAVADFNSGKYEDALKVFEQLADISFKDADSWISKVNYAIAEELYDSGDYYAAWQAFKSLGFYEDAADRMAKCTTSYPSNGELYHNSSYSSTRSSIVIDASAADYVGYYKIYDGSTLVATLWAGGGSSVEIELPEGDYSIKQAVGSDWFGDEVMFGDEGYYEVMTFDDGNEYFHLGDNIKATLTLAQSTAGNVGSKPTNREDF